MKDTNYSKIFVKCGLYRSICIYINWIRPIQMSRSILKLRASDWKTWSGINWCSLQYICNHFKVDTRVVSFYTIEPFMLFNIERFGWVKVWFVLYNRFIKPLRNIWTPTKPNRERERENPRSNCISVDRFGRHFLTMASLFRHNIDFILR